MSKRKAKKVTFWLAYKKPIIITVAASVVIYIIVYLAFRWNGILPAGTDLEKSDWLSFLGAYLSFVGTVIVSMIAIFQSRYYSELAEKKDAASRKKDIQPIFSVNIVAIDVQLDGTAEAFSLSGKGKNPVHKNVKISVENVNRFPIKHVIVFNKYVQENCDIALSDNCVIYGHHMNNGTMFTDLCKYENEDFYREHKTIHFDTLSGFGEYEIVAVFKTVAYSEQGFKYYHFTRAESAEDFDAYIAQCKVLSLYDTGAMAEYGDKLITLSTCEYSRKNGRMVVVAKRIAAPSAEVGNNA